MSQRIQALVNRVRAAEHELASAERALKEHERSRDLAMLILQERQAVLQQALSREQTASDRSQP